MNQTDQTGVFPTAGEILGLIVDRLGSDSEILTSRTARRFFDGESIKDENQQELLVEFANQLVRTGIVPESAVLANEGRSVAEMIAIGLSNLGRQWNRLVSELESSTAAIADPIESAHAISRILIPDLALRIFGLLRLNGSRLGTDRVHEWMLPRGEEMVLRNHLTAAGLSRDDLASEMGVSDGSVDNWFDGNNSVSDSLLVELVDALASNQSSEDILEISGGIRREILAARLCALSVSVFGQDKTDEMVNTLLRLIGNIEVEVAGMDRPPIEEMCRAEIDCVIGGALDRGSGVLLRNIALLEKDPEWKEDLELATLDWKLQAQHLMVRLHRTGTAAGLAMDYESLFDQGVDGTGEKMPEVDREAMRAIQVMAPSMEWGRMRSSFPNFQGFVDLLKGHVEDYRNLAIRFPDSAYAHSQTGSMIGKLAEFLGDPNLVTEAIIECKIAAVMCPDWDLPNVEIGIILANHRRFEEALAELEESLHRMLKITPHFAYSRGYVLENLGRHKEALTDYEFVLDHSPDYAIALDGAARCAFLSSDHSLGMKYAKRARLRGETAAYDEWRGGRFRASTA